MHEDIQEIIETQVYEEVRFEEQAESEPLRQTSWLEKAAFSILLGVIFFVPVFFLPFEGVVTGFSKNLFLSVSVIFVLIFMFFFWLQKGALVLPRGLIFGSAACIVVFSILSSFLSSSFEVSFFGGGAETTTSLEFLLLAILLFLFAVFFRSKERLFMALAAVFLSAVVVFVFQLLHIFFPNLTLPLGLSPEKAANFIGSWSDFGVFSGMIVLLSLVALEMMPNKSQRMRTVLYGVLATGLLFHILALYTYSWITLALAAFLLSVFIFFRSVKRISAPAEGFETVQTGFLSAPFIIAAMSAVFIFAGPKINAKFFEVLHISPIQEVRPSWVGTYQATKGALTPIGKKTLTGVGPNRFFVSWQEHRPKEVNYTPWWAIDFNEGVGTISSFLASSGVLGFLSWVVFLLAFVVGGFFALRRNLDRMEPFTQYLAVSFFAGASYLWVTAFTNTVGVVPFTLAFILSGLFLGLMSKEGLAILFEQYYAQNPQKGFAIATVLLLMIGATAMLGYEIFLRTQSVFAYRGSLIASANGDLSGADAKLIAVVRFHESDSYYRTISVFNSYQAGQLALRKDLPSDDLREQFGLRFRASIESANKAIELDRENYLNWITLGNAYALLATLGAEDLSLSAYTQAKTAYEEAGKHNAFNPQIPYIMTQLALSSGHADEADDFIQRSLELKNDYADALVLLSQIEESRGRNDQALAVIESAANLSDPKILFQLGYLRYKTGKYNEAVSALEKTIRVIPEYSNAKYFLGLSYFETGRKKDAIREFSDIERLNPGRSDITQILRNLESGYAPLSAPVPEEAPALFDLSTTTAATSDKKR